MRKHRGYTLIELMVTMAVMSIVMVGIFQVFQEGMQLFRTHARAADAQQSAVRVLGIISAELVNATPEVSKNYDDGSGEPTGIVFATSLTEDGATRFNEFNGKIYWQRYIAYYFEPDAVDSNGKIYRAVLPIPDDPSGGPGHLDVDGVVAPFVNSTPTSAFQADGSAKKRMVADAISGFNVTVYDGSEGGNTGLAQTKVFEVTVEAGNPESQQLRNGYFIQVQSRVAPRG